MSQAIISEYFAQIGSRGGKARAKKLSPQRRREIAIKAVTTRWTRAKILDGKVNK
jgi:hypothetical protein